MSFTDKVVLVTGGSSGIGAATAIKFSEEGAKVAIVGRNKNKLENVEKCCEENGCNPLVINADLTNDEDVNRIMITTINHFGKIDVLVNNAGICCFTSITSENAMKTFDKTMAVNLRAAVHLSHLALPHLLKTKGNIINISSVGSISVLLDHNFSYCSSKAALDHFTRSIAMELGPQGIRVNMINPGPVKTDYIDNLVPDKKQQEKFHEMLQNRTVLGKQAECNEIADLILYIASEKAGSITGASFVIDNGMLLKG